MGKSTCLKNSKHNVKSEKYANKISTIKYLKEFCGRNADSFHNIKSTFYNMESTILIFHIVEITMWMFPCAERMA